MERQLQFYMDKAFIFEENGYFSESLELCNKCLEAYPEYENEIVFEIAKMNYRNGRLEDALLYFVKFYERRYCYRFNIRYILQGKSTKIFNQL